MSHAMRGGGWLPVSPPGLAEPPLPGLGLAIINTIITGGRAELLSSIDIHGGGSKTRAVRTAVRHAVRIADY